METKTGRKTSSAKRLVLVEDNIDSRITMGMLLENLGYEISIAEDGEQGLAVISDERPDVALIDIGLPILDGYQVASELRNRGVDCKLVALTGYGQPEDRERALSAGFDEHLVKPIDVDQLKTVLNRLG